MSRKSKRKRRKLSCKEIAMKRTRWLANQVRVEVRKYDQWLILEGPEKIKFKFYELYEP